MFVYLLNSRILSWTSLPRRQKYLHSNDYHSGKKENVFELVDYSGVRFESKVYVSVENSALLLFMWAVLPTS